MGHHEHIGHFDLLIDPKDHCKLIGRFDVVYDVIGLVTL